MQLCNAGRLTTSEISTYLNGRISRELSAVAQLFK